MDIMVVIREEMMSVYHAIKTRWKREADTGPWQSNEAA